MALAKQPGIMRPPKIAATPAAKIPKNPVAKPKISFKPMKPPKLGGKR